ncbi:hypothetical protein TR51_31890 [Kitasatospora griseola]|uniref:Amidohydrolase-related domain-containing protein n=1 Tax=Kitasatospora griseola TaxID=2064 RepID=A0A0D0PXH9_KITGR|nr:hypothetical protein [Kitasatospora griseola]KIQ63308.1 hypothetical protein TR51_31890 [Kitasatospora griseola]
MLTLHRARLVLADPTAPPLVDGAVLVAGATVAEIGPFSELAGRPARVREWDGVLVPGLVNRHGRWLLECAYHPDPREESGDQPLAPPDELTDERWGGSARRGLQRMLAFGATAVTGPFDRPSVRTAATRSGLHVLPGDGTPGALDPLDGRPLGTAVHRALTAGGAADFAVFDARTLEDVERGAGCLATVLGGRLLHRRR